jgi:beta-carotene 15,15'-dioxygenase
MRNIEWVGKLSAILIGCIYLIWFEGNQTLQWILFLIILLTVGIPHGAIDHILTHPAMSKIQLLVFILKYVGIMAVYLVLWIVSPKAALFSFIMMSAFHFGQTHYLNFKIDKFKFHIYFSTGIYYLAIILFGDFDYTVTILSDIVEIADWKSLGMGIILGSFILTNFLIFLNSLKIRISFMLEMIITGFLLYHLPLILSFILYFGFWHALPSMVKEYSFLKTEEIAKNPFAFIQKLIPFTLLSITGIVLLLIMFHFSGEGNLLLLFFILVSLISAPHIWFMNRFLSALKN